MCGIVGYIGQQKAKSILIEGLKRLEYRGYDSAGLSILEGGKIKIFKAVGKVANLEEKLFASRTGTTNAGHANQLCGSVGIAHTRWATHGKPCDKNSHPHTDCKGKIHLVHNGIIENYQELKSLLQKKGHKFRSETDSEVMAHLIEEFLEKKGETFEGAVLEAVKILKGTYGLAIINSEDPGKIIAARMGSPLVLGLGKNEYILASDVSAIVRHTDQVIYLEDGEMAIIEKDNYEIRSINNKVVNDKSSTNLASAFSRVSAKSTNAKLVLDKKITKLDWDLGKAEKKWVPSFYAEGDL